MPAYHSHVTKLTLLFSTESPGQNKKFLDSYICVGGHEIWKTPLYHTSFFCEWRFGKMEWFASGHSK